MKPEPATEKSIFLDALDIESPSDRAAFIEAACQGNPELAASVSALLREHEREDNPIDKPIAQGVNLQLGTVDETALVPPQAEPSHQALGTLIGPYKLMEQIGEGGMGVVYVAEQQHPVKRRVALKIIKPGMDTKEVLARFEAERQNMIADIAHELRTPLSVIQGNLEAMLTDMLFVRCSSPA